MQKIKKIKKKEEREGSHCVLMYNASNFKQPNFPFKMEIYAQIIMHATSSILVEIIDLKEAGVCNDAV